MNRGLYYGVETMRAAERRLEVITTNLANISVAGYKRRGASTTSFDATLRGRLERQVDTRTKVDFSQGPLEATGGEYDLALSGRGFFALETPAGEAYTRGGRFRVDEAGVLQAHDGNPVAWDGARGTIDPRAGAVLIDPEGQVWQDGSQLGRLRLVDFADPARLEPDGSGYLHAQPGLAEAPHQAEVRQGHIEGANVSAVEEMVALISTQRSYEASARLMSMIEQTYQRLTSR